ncbi:MAG: GAF domain-containing protein [Chloroflexota bacterium]
MAINPKTSLDVSLIHAFAQISVTVLDLDDLLGTGLDMLSQSCDYVLAAIVLVDEQGKHLPVRAQKGSVAYDQINLLDTQVQTVLKSGQSVLEPNLTIDKTNTEPLTGLILPLTIGRLVTGAFLVVSSDITPQQEQLMALFASQMIVAITNAKLYQRLKDQQQQEVIRRQIATHLQQLTTIINATLDLDEVLELILAHIEEVIPYNKALITLVEGQALIVQAAKGFANSKIKSGFSLLIPPNGFYYHILSQQYPTIIQDIQTESQWTFKPVLEVKDTKAWIGAPLVIKGQVIGLLTLHHQDAGYFDTADPDLVNTFANQAAIAIDNAQVYQREQQKVKQFRTVARIGRQATEIYEIQPLLETVLERLHEDLGYEFVTLLLYDIETDSLVLSAASDVSNEEIRQLDKHFPLEGPGVFSIVGRSGEPLVINDVHAFQGYIFPERRAAVQSELAIPLMSKGQLIGLLDIQSTSLQAFSPDDLVLIQTIADQLAVAISTSNLFEDRDQRLAELLVFDEISELIADPNDLENTLNTVLYNVRALLQADITGLVVLKQARLSYQAVVGSASQNLQSLELKTGEGLSGWAIEHNQAILSNNVAYDSRHNKELDTLLGFQIESILTIPVQIQGKVLGAIEVINGQGRSPLAQDDQVILSFIASALAVSMENVRLVSALHQKVDQMAGLFEASRALTNLDLGEVLRITVKQVVGLLYAESATVYVIDESGKMAVPGASYSIEKDFRPPVVYEQGADPIGQIIENKLPIRINDVQQSVTVFDSNRDADRIHSFLAVPLIASGSLIGILETTNKQGGQVFSAEDEAFFTALAGHAAMAIYNAQLYETVVDRENFVRILGATGAEINKNLHLDSVLGIIGEKSLTLFDVDAVSVWRMQEVFLSCLTAKGLDAEQMPETQFQTDQDQSFVIEVLESKRPIFYNQVEPSSYYLSGTVKQKTPISIVGIPLVGGEVFSGVLVLTNIRDAQAFSAEGVAKAVIYANQISSAIENAILHQETTIRLAEVSTLYTMAHQMTINIDINHLLDGTVNVIRLALDSSGGSIFLLEDGELVLSAQNGRLSIAGHAYIIKAVQKVIESLNPINLRTPVDFASIEEDQPEDINSLMMVPLVAHGKLLGALTIHDSRPNMFGSNEGRLLTIVAVQIASALENSKLFKDLQQHALNLESALTELQEFSQLQGEFVQNVSHE